MNKIRRSRCLMAFWENGEFVLENYLSHKQCIVSPLVVQLLSGALEDYKDLGEVQLRFSKLPEGEKLLAELLEQDILVQSDTHLSAQEDQINETWTWREDAKYFHFSSKHIRYQSDPKVQNAELVALSKSEPPPNIFKEYIGERRNLKPSLDEKGAFWETLLKRRTIREYRSEPLSFDLFSKLVQWTWGKTGHGRSEIGEFLLKTSPSGGAKHPVEVYPLVLNVKDLEAGLYHYSTRDNALVLLKKGDFRESAVQWCAHQQWIRNTAVVFFMTAVLPRNMWKYRHSRALRIVLLETGHLGQTFHLICTQLGLAPFTTAATYDEAIEAFLEIDGITETLVYTASVGLPKN